VLGGLLGLIPGRDVVAAVDAAVLGSHLKGPVTPAMSRWKPSVVLGV
jgi:hypothetical protein